MGTWSGGHLNRLLLEGYPHLFVFVSPTQGRIHREGGNWSLIWFRSCVCPNGSFTLGHSAKIIFLKFWMLIFPFHQLTLWANLLRNWVFLKKLASFARQFCTSLSLGPLGQPMWRGTLWCAPAAFGFSLQGCLPLSPFPYNPQFPKCFGPFTLTRSMHTALSICSVLLRGSITPDVLWSPTWYYSFMNPFTRDCLLSVLSPWGI